MILVLPETNHLDIKSNDRRASANFINAWPRRSSLLTNIRHARPNAEDIGLQVAPCLRDGFFGPAPEAFPALAHIRAYRAGTLHRSLLQPPTRLPRPWRLGTEWAGGLRPRSAAGARLSRRARIRHGESLAVRIFLSSW